MKTEPPSPLDTARRLDRDGGIGIYMSSEDYIRDIDSAWREGAWWVLRLAVATAIICAGVWLAGARIAGWL